MRLQSALTLLLANTSAVHSLTLPNLDRALPRRDLKLEAELVSAPLAERFDASLLNDLEKRRGGGGSSGSGGSGGGGGSGGRSGGSSSSSGSSGSGSGSSGSSRYKKTLFILVTRNS